MLLFVLLAVPVPQTLTYKILDLWLEQGYMERLVPASLISNCSFWLISSTESGWIWWRKV